MSLRFSETRATWVGRIGAALALIVLSLATLGVWWNEIRHDREALRVRSDEVSRQASRQLEAMVDARLMAAAVCADRWGLHEVCDGPREAFRSLAVLLTMRVAGIHSVRLIRGDGGTWVEPAGAEASWERVRASEPDLVERSLKRGDVLLSAPVNLGGGVRRFFAVIPIAAKGEASLVVELDPTELIAGGFEDIRTDFSFEVFDSGEPVFQFTPEGPTATHRNREFGAQWEFPMRNRAWGFAVVPLSKETARAMGLGSWPFLVLGLLLSAGLAAMVNLLARRMEMFREAHHQARSEIAERERAEAALRESEERYRSVFAAATDGLLLIDDDDRVVQANPAACRMHGRSPNALDGMSVFDLISPVSRHLYASFKKQPDGFDMVRAEAVHVRADGSTIDVEARASSIQVASGRRTLAILTDVTERKEAVRRLAMLSRKALMAQEDERARVSRDLHDELGQLLTASRFELGCLQKYAAELPDEVSNALARAIERVQESTDELRRICRGLRPPLLDDLGLEPAARALVQEFEERGSLTIESKVQVDESEPLAKEVALCAYRVLQEGLNNVVRHARARRVVVALTTGASELRLQVRDDGVGFDTADSAGQGVGIAGMRERASLVGGELRIDSEPSRGTELNLVIPLSDAPREAGP